jgi:hypothetical protein
MPETRGEQPDDPRDVNEPNQPSVLDAGVEETVDALLETVRGLLQEENNRDQSFNARALGLAGFAGIIVSLSTTVGHDALKVTWSGPWQAVAVILFAAALLALVGTVVMAVSGVLRPRLTTSLSVDEVKKYPLPQYVFAHKVMNQGKTLHGLVEALAVERGRAVSKAAALKWGYRLLILGLSCIAGLGFLLGLHDANVIGAADANSRTGTQPGQRGGKRSQPRGHQPGRGHRQRPAGHRQRGG